MIRRSLVAATTGAAVLALATPASAVRFTTLGDWGAGTAAQARVAKQACAWHTKARSSFIATVGDNFYSIGAARPATWQTPMRCLINTRLPWRAAWGNHDAGGGTSTATVLKSPKRWYSVAIGEAVRLIFLDSNQPSSGAQLAFLKSTLQSEVGSRRALIVLYHHPTRTAGLHPPVTTQQRLWEPLFVKYGVKLVLQGHNHNYERIQYKNVTYITTGGGGADLYPCMRPATGLKICQARYQFLMVEATPLAIVVRAIDDKGRIFDKIRLDPPRVK